MGGITSMMYFPGLTWAQLRSRDARGRIVSIRSGDARSPRTDNEFLLV